MTITVDEQDRSVEQITKQLHKLINVLKITDLDPADSVERELPLIKVKADADARGRRSCRWWSSSGPASSTWRSDVLVIEMTGTREKVSAFTDLLQPFGIVELMRTGRIAMGRGTGPT